MFLTFNNPEEKAFENLVGKRENIIHQHFLLFQQCFFYSTESDRILSTLSLLSALIKIFFSFQHYVLRLLPPERKRGRLVMS